MSIQGPAKSPCGSCPYRQDVPPGVWADQEYAKLPAYDGQTWEQPTGLFLCHQRDGRLCAGWVGCHDMNHSLAIRLGRLTPEVVQEVFDYTSPVPLWNTGQQAATHGMQPKNAKAERVVNKLMTRRSQARGRDGTS